MKVGNLMLLLGLLLFIAGCNDHDESLNNPIDDTPPENAAVLSSNVVYQWTDMMLELERYASGRPCGAARSLAYMYLAAYETAVPGMNNQFSNTARFNELLIDESQRPADISYEIALNSTFAAVVDHFLNGLSENQQASIDEFRISLESELSTDFSQELIDNSNAWGNYVANQVIAFSQTDLAAEAQILDPQPISYEPPTGEGFWTYSADPERALFPYWENVRTFVITPEETTSVPPIAYSESRKSEYYKQMKEVYEANNEAREADDEDLWIAEFWSDDAEGIMMSPPARQFSIANQLIDQFDLNLEESLQLTLRLGFSLNDAAVATWKYKYEYMVMRPNVYIHEFIDPDFQTNLFRIVYWPNPSFPGYPSGHSSFASAAAGIFIDFFGNEVDFTDRTHEGRTEFQGDPRTFSSFKQMAKENAFSRLPLGVHMDMDCEEGLRLGYEIANAINAWQDDI